MKKKHKILLGMLVLAGCLLFGCEKRRTELFSEEKQDTEEAGATSGQEEQELQSSQQITASQTVFVHVCGAVENPGCEGVSGGRSSRWIFAGGL